MKSVRNFIKNHMAGKPVFTFRDLMVTVAALVLATVLGFVFEYFGLGESNIILLYIIAVMFIAALTPWQRYSLIASFVGVLVFNFFFTEPRLTLFAYDKDYPVTFLIMFIAAFLTSSLAIRLKVQVRQASRAAALIEKEQLRANLLRMISHDLRTPLTSISGNASNLISNGTEFDEETKQQLYKDIYEESMWLINLVENLLSVNRIEEGRTNLKMTVELLDEVIAEALRHVNRISNHQEICVDLPDELLFVKIDAKLIVQVIINIVNNAMKYTPPDSKVVITAGNEGEWTAVRIADNGNGIDEETRAHIFEMFYTGKQTVADSRRSMGVGLSLCKSVIQAHGGTITVSENKPHGAVFTFTLRTYRPEIEDHIY